MVASPKRALEQTADGGTPFEMTLHLGPGLGEVRIGQLRGEFLRDESGQLKRVVGTLLDVSINQFCIENAEEAVFWLSGTGGMVYVNAAACRLLGYVASHDLQEPLRSIVSFSQLLERRIVASLAEEDRQSFNFVVSSAKRMNQLVNGILAYSRINAKDAAFGLVPLGGACSAAIANLHDSIAESGAEIAVGDLPEVVGDVVQLTQLFQNLIGNAIKFRRHDTKPLVVVSAVRSEEGWIISVTDNGIGIESTDQDIFELFRRLHPIGSFPGSGAGLTICKQIVQRHNGRIWYDSHPGEGASFHVMLSVGEVAVPNE